VTSEWLPAATFGAGVIGTLGGQGLTQWLTWKREEKARLSGREVARDAFQRETLIALQDAATRAARIAYRQVAHFHGIIAAGFRASHAYAAQPFPESLITEKMEAMGDASHLSARVLDDDLRERVADALSLCAAIGVGLIEATPNAEMTAVTKVADQRVQELTGAIQALDARLGIVLREVL
jgi:hypothetical protein